MKATGASVVAAAGLGAGITGSASAQNITISPLARDGNKIVDPSGNEIILRGTNIADPCEQSRPWRGQTADETVQLATDEGEGWYNRCIRVPCQPEFIAAGTEAPAPGEMPHGDDWGPLLPGQFDATDVEYYCETFVDSLVELGRERGAYVMIDYHRHYPVFHQMDHQDHGVDPNVWQCTSDGGTDWRNPEVCGERDPLWHGEDQVDDIMAAVEDQNVLEAFDLTEDDIYLEPPEITNALDEELHTFWEVVADRYAGDDHVIFDVYNEPTGPYGGDWGGPERQAGALSDPEAAPGDAEGDYDVAVDDMKVWYDLWRQRAQPWVDTVEENAPGHLVTIGNPRWSQYTYWAPYNEFQAENMCYTAHVYTQDELRPLSQYFGAASEQVPIFFSEFGWIEGGGEHVETPWMDCTQGDESPEEANCDPYIQEYEEFIQNYPVHPQTWCFDHTWEPNFFEHGTPGQNDGAKGADDWMNYLWDATPGQWWHELNQELAGDRDQPAPGNSQYPDAENCMNSMHQGFTHIGAPSWASDDDVCDGDTGGDGPVVDGTPTGDTNGDGLYNDINGDGDASHEDVTTFFENLESDDVQGNADAFDFDGDEQVGFSDVVSLFEYI